MCLFFFKQKTAYDMRISDWSSDVCSSDLCRSAHAALDAVRKFRDHGRGGKHAFILGALDRRGHIRCAAGLRIKLYPALDVLHRHIFCADCAVFTSRGPGYYSNTAVMSLMEVKNLSQHFGSLVAVTNVSMAVERGELRSEEHTSELQSL